MADETLLSFERGAWVIPNGHGQLWTDRIFSSQEEAKAYLMQNWVKTETPPKKVKPVLARVQVSAALIAAEDRHG